MSRSEDILTAIADGTTIDIVPQCRKEQFLKAIADGDATNLPEPTCREEILLKQIAENGVGGNGSLADLVQIPERLVEIELPEGVSSINTSFYSSTGDFIISHQKTGIWYYDVENNEWINSYPYSTTNSVGYGSVAFYEAEGYIFTNPSSNSLDRIKLFNRETKMFDDIDADSSTYHYNFKWFVDSRGEIFVASPFTDINGVQKFNKEINKLEFLGGINAKGYYVLGEDIYGNVFFSGDTTYGKTLPTAVYDRETNSLVKISDEAVMSLIQSEDKSVTYLINASSSGASGVPSLFRYDNDSKTLVLVTDALYEYLNVATSTNVSLRIAKYYFSNNNSLYFIQKNQDTTKYEILCLSDGGLTSLCETNITGNCYWVEVNNKIFVSYINNSYLGLHIIDTDSNSVDNSMSSAYAMYLVHSVGHDIYFSNGSSYTGIYKLDSEGIISTINTTYYKLLLMDKINDDTLLMVINNGTYLYNISAETFTRLTSSTMSEIYKYNNLTYVYATNENITNIFIINNSDATYVEKSNKPSITRLFEIDGELYGTSSSMYFRRKFNPDTNTFDIMYDVYDTSYVNSKDFVIIDSICLIDGIRYLPRVFYNTASSGSAIKGTSNRDSLVGTFCTSTTVKHVLYVKPKF